MTLSDQTLGTHHLPVGVCLIQLSGLSHWQAVHPLSHHSTPPFSPGLPAPTLKKGPPPQISVSNPRWPTTFFNRRGELARNQLPSGRVASRRAHRRFSGERGRLREKAGWALGRKASSAATDVKNEGTRRQDSLHTRFIHNMFAVLRFRQTPWTV